MKQLLHQATKQPGFVAVFTFIAGLACVTLLCLGVGAYAAIWEKTMPVELSPLEKLTNPSSKDTELVTASSCQDTCALEFNYCKFTKKEADVACLTKNDACIKACPAQKMTPEDKEDYLDQVGESIAYGPAPLVTCQEDRLYPVNPRASYIILTRPMFRDTLLPFIRAKQAAGEQVETVEIDSFLCSEPGNDIPEKIRHYLGRASQAIIGLKGLPKVLIVGAPERVENSEGVFLNANLVNTGRALESAWEIPMRYYGRMAGGIPIPTDQYYASLTPTWNTDINSGERDQWAMDFDFNVSFWVGRIPVRTITELRNWVNTNLRWRTPTGAFIESNFQSWLCRHRVPRSEDTWETSATHMIIPHACQTDSGGDIASYVNQELPDLVTSYSHGNVRGVTREPNPEGYTLTVDSMGFTKPPIMFIHGCEVGGVDYNQQSLMESYIGRTNGVVAFIGSTRSHWDSRFSFTESIFNKGYLTLGEAFYRTKMSMVKEAYLPGKLVDNLFMFSLFGDPGLVTVAPTAKISVIPRNTIAHVPALQPQEIFSTPVTLRSYTAEPRRGGLYYYNTQSSDVTLPGFGRVTSNLVSTSTDPSLHHTGSLLRQRIMFSYPRTIKFSSPTSDTACDTTRMTCIANQIKIAPPLHLSCARIKPRFEMIDGTWQITEKTASVKIISQDSRLISGPVTLILKLKTAGYLTPMEEFDAFNPDTATEIVRQNNILPETAHVYELRYASNPPSERYTGDRAGQTYYGARYFVDAIDSRGEHVGLCSYSFELDTENTGL